MCTRSTGVLILAGIILLLTAAGSSTAQGWGTPQRLQADSEVGVKNPHICPASSGGFHALYEYSIGPWRTEYRRFLNGTLTAPVIIYTNSFLPAGDICEAGNGDLHAVWENWNGAEQIWWSKSSDGGATWIPAQPITSYPTSPDGQAKNPIITPYGPAGSPNVMMNSWEADEKALYYNRYNGSSWLGNTPIPQFTDNYYAAWGAARSPVDGSLYRCYGRNVGGAWQICVRRYNGTSWEPESIVSKNTHDEFASRPSIAINDFGQIMIVWDQDTKVYSRTYYPDWGWTPQTEVGEGCYASVTAVPGRKDFYVAYANSTTNGMLGRRYVAQKWMGAETISIGIPPVHQEETDICAGVDRTLYVCWGTYPSPGPVAVYNINTVFVSSDTTAPSAPASVADDGVTTDSATALHATWPAASDAQSGIDHYEYSIGTAPGATDVRYWTYVGPSTQVTAYALNLTPGETYFVNIIAVNGAGIESAVVSSDGIRVAPAPNLIAFGAVAVVSSASGDCDRPILASSAEGGMHLIYRDTSGGASRIAYRRLIGDAWSAIEASVNGAVAAYYPDMVEDEAGNVHCIFTNPDGRESTDLWEVVRGASGWSSAQLLTGGGRTVNWYPRLAAGGGLVHCVVNGDATAYNVKHLARNAAGWSPIEDIGSGAWAASRYGMPEAAVDSAGNVSVVWTTPTEVRFTRRTGAGWSAPVAIAVHSGAFLAYPRIVLGPTGLAHVVYADHNVGPDPALYYVKETSPGSWAAPELVANGFYPSIALDSNGRLHLAYGKSGDIYHKFLNGSTWSQERNLSSNAGQSEWPCLRMDSAGYLNIVWRDNTAGVYQVLYRKSLGEPPSCSYAKQLADGSSVDMYAKIVSANFVATDSCIYVQEPDRTAGIRVNTTRSDLAVGDVVDVSGTVSTRVISGKPAEKQITASAITKFLTGEAVKPLAMNCGSVGGGPVGSVPGVQDGVGLNNMGLLVRVTGKVTYKAGQYLYVDDGSNVANVYGLSTSVTGIMVKCPSSSIPVGVGDVVSVTGVVVGSVPSSAAWTTNRRFIQTRSWDDLRFFGSSP